MVQRFRNVMIEGIAIRIRRRPKRQHRLLPPKPKKALNAFSAYLKDSIRINGSAPRKGDTMKRAAQEWKVMPAERQQIYKTSVVPRQIIYKIQMNVWKQQKALLKRPCSAYSLFVRDLYRREGGNRRMNDFGRISGPRWQNLPGIEKALYRVQYNQNRVRYLQMIDRLNTGEATINDFLVSNNM